MSDLKDVRWRQRFANFAAAYSLLAKYRDRANASELERAGVIQFFEVSFELAWKLMKDYLESQQIYVQTPRDAIKQSFQIGLIDDGHIWIDALTDRNRTVHTYDQAVANQMATDISQVYFPELEKLYERLQREL